MKFKRAKISLELGVTPDETGLLKVWWRKEGGEMNAEYKAKIPVWSFLEAEALYLLVIGETIEITENRLNKYFELVV